MESIQILASGKCLPGRRIGNGELNSQFALPDGWIERRTGILARYQTDEPIVWVANEAVKNLGKKYRLETNKIGLIVVTSTSTDKIMPGISFEIQKALEIEKCICLDILAGCSGYINAFDIARKYIALR